jgi:2-C-methyl-D-erythritol 4-phosphate cytidylyltransferase
MMGTVLVGAVVVAAGRGERFGGPKQLQPLGDRRIVDHAVDAARATCDTVVLVVPPGAEWTVVGVTAVPGGDTRSASVRAGLAAVSPDVEIVVVHDAARPLADAALFDRVIAAVRSGAEGAVPGVPIADTVKRVAPGGEVTATLPRDELVAVQTPQAFRADVLRGAHASEPEGTDDAAVVEAAGGRVVVVAGAVDNFKITEPADLERAAEVVARRTTVR